MSILSSRAIVVVPCLLAGLLAPASVAAEVIAEVEDQAGASEAPAIFINLAPITVAGAVSTASHAAILGGAGLGLRIGEASGEAAMHLGTGAYDRHYNAELQGRYFSSPSTYLIGMLQYGWVAADADGRAYANATAFVGFGAMLGGSRHLYAEIALGTGNAWITEAAGAQRSVFEGRAQLRVGWALGRFSPSLPPR